MKFFLPKKSRLSFLFFLLTLFLSISLWGKEIVLFAQSSLSNLPTINLNKANDSYNTSRGGLISMSSVEEPAISLGSWNLDGEVDLKLFKADESSLISYLVHDSENKQLHPEVDTSKFDLVSEFKAEIFHGNGGNRRVDLPLEESGIWYLTMQSGESKNSVFIVRSKNGLIVQEAKDTLVLWGQQFSDLRKLTSGTVTLYDMEGSAQILAQEELNSDGIATVPHKQEDADIIVLRQGDDIAIAPVNLTYLNVGYSYQRFNYESDIKHFVFTDRPLYRPGGKVYYKAIIRIDDDARYSAANGLARVIIYKDWDKDNRVFDKLVPLNSNGAVDGEFALPEDVSTGYYNIFIAHASEDIDDWGSGSTAQFQVEHFRKPEYTISADSTQLEIIKGDTAEFVISGEYFSGQPLSNQKVEYEISARDSYDSEYLRESSFNDKNHYFGYGGTTISSDAVELNEQGKSTVTIDTNNLAISENRVKVITLTAHFNDESGNPVETAQNILLYPGEFSVYRSDYTYTQSINKNYDLKLQLVPNGNFSVSDMEVTANIKRSWWEETDTGNYTRKEEVLSGVSSKSDSDGIIHINYKPEQAGSYTFTVNVTDERGNTVTKDFGAWIRSDEYNYFYDYYNGSNDMSVSSDKPTYQPGENAQLFITSQFPYRDVLLSFQRDRVDRYQVVSLNDTNTTISVPILDVDMPNTFVKLSSFISHTLSTTTKELSVPANKKKINVSIQTDKDMYGPGQSAVVTVETKDINGNPVPAEVTVWSVDKALYELAYDQTKDIFNYFWKDRYQSSVIGHSLEGIRVDGPEGGGGCFLENTKISMSDGSVKDIEDIKVGDSVLTRKSETNPELISSKVLSVHTAQEDGYLIINENLKVTPNHIVYLNNIWQEVGNAQVGDTFVNSLGESVSVTSIEWMLGKQTVYNFEVETYNTYFANNLWVHNQKGDTRSIFKDTAYWNPTVQTGSTGVAQLIIPLPDNLTTWVIAGIASNQETQVGQTTAEIKVSKDLVVRPVLPNLLRTGDKINFMALVNNFTNEDQTITATLELAGTEVRDSIIKGVSVLKNSLENFVWEVVVGQSALNSKLSVKAETESGEIDEVVQELPIVQKGFVQSRALVGFEPTKFELDWSNDILRENSSIELSLSSSKVGMLPSAMKYLIAYPYGCVEQTTSRFVPVLLANENKELFASVTQDKDLDKMVEKGIVRLTDLQKANGGWNWWSGNETDLFISSYIAEYLLKAQTQGYAVPAYVLNNLEHFFTIENYNSLEEQVFREYGLQLLGSTKSGRIFTVSEIDQLSEDIIPYAVITNIWNGVTDNSKNGTEKLASLSKTQGNLVYWEAGDSNRFGSRDASTAIAVRALLLTDPNSELISKAVNYLALSRKSSYWSNTFGTVQVARALLDYSNVKNELDANYNYKVLLDGKEIISGSVNGSSELNQSLHLNTSSLKESGSTLEIQKNGEGQIYSTVLMEEFFTQTQPVSQDTQLNITRNYVSERGYEYGVSVGDIITVELTVEGLESNTPYILIEDELPAGLIPINTHLVNEDAERRNYYESKEYTENGVIIALRRSRGGIQTVTYKARAIASGEFYAPPAKVEHMYSPEYSALSQDEKVVITQEPKIIRERQLKEIISKNLNKTPTEKVYILLTVLVLILFSVLIYLTGSKRNSKIDAYIILLKEKIQEKLKQKE